MQARLGVILAAAAFALAAVASAAIFLPVDMAEPRVQQALVAGIVVSFGWFAGFVLREVSAHLGRVERMQDVHRALFAEIRHNLENLASEMELRDYGEEMLERIRASDRFVPFIPRERNDTVFRSIVADIHVLPRVTIDPIVQYYAQVAALDALADDLRGSVFAEMAPPRRAKLYADYIGLKIACIDYGREATRVIDAYTNESGRRARALSREIRSKRSRRQEMRRDVESGQ